MAQRTVTARRSTFRRGKSRIRSCRQKINRFPFLSLPPCLPPSLSFPSLAFPTLRLPHYPTRGKRKLPWRGFGNRKKTVSSVPLARIQQGCRVPRGCPKTQGSSSRASGSRDARMGGDSEEGPGAKLMVCFSWGPKRQPVSLPADI